MKDGRNLKRSMQARYRQMFRHAADIAALADQKQPSELTTIDLANLREDVATLAQCFHEFNAYRNALELPTKDVAPADAGDR